MNVERATTRQFSSCRDIQISDTPDTMHKYNQFILESDAFDDGRCVVSKNSAGTISALNKRNLNRDRPGLITLVNMS